MTDLPSLITAFTTLFVIVDPIGLSPLFIALTRGMSDAQRRSIAISACLMAAGMLTLFAFFGEHVLGFLGISMHAFRIAGGILLFLTALDMLFQRRQERRSGTADEASQDDHSDDPSIFPLGIPLIAGPGSMATVILLTGQADGFAGVSAVLLVMIAVIACVFVAFMAAGPLERALGPVGSNVVTRLLGMLLAALSVQFILDGLQGFGMFGA